MNYNRKKSPSSTEANNNIDFSYYSPHESYIQYDNTFQSIISKVPIDTHIDRIYFHCYLKVNEPEKLLFKALSDHNYSSVKDQLASKGMYERRSVFIDKEKDITITILYKRREFIEACYPDISVIIDNPDIKVIDWFDAICNAFGFITILSYVELALDFYSSVSFLKEYLCHNIVLKYHRGDCGYECGEGCDGCEKGSYYIGNKNRDYYNNKPKNSKSLIIYRKELEDIDVLRLEFRFNRAFLKRKDLELDCFDKINNIDLSKIVDFKRLNYEKLIKFLKKKHESTDSMFHENDSLLLHQLGDLTDNENTVMKQIICMKKSPYRDNCQRFFEDISDSNLAFYDRLKNAKYI